MIIVTGGAGFIGSNIVKELNAKGIDDIIIVDNLENSSKHFNLNRLEFRDLVDKTYFRENLEKFKSHKIEAIFHQGACSDTMEYNGRFMLDNNYEYSKNILHFALENKIRFLYASSASVYGDGKNGFKEERPSEYPLNIYAFSKFLFDQYVRRMIKNTEFQVVGLRYFNVYGPQENHKGQMTSVIFHFHNQILKEGKIKLFEGSENFKRDFIYVKDAVKVNMFFFENPKISGIFNCGTGRARSFCDIATIMQPLYDKEIKIEFIPFPEKLRGKYQTFTEANLEKLKSIGYSEPFIDLETGILEYVELLKTTNGYYR